MVQQVLSKFRSLLRGPENAPQPQFLPPTLLTENTLRAMLSQLNIERIRRTIMLFDIRWLKEDNTSYIPEEEQIAQEAYSAMIKALVHGRVLGVAEVRDKGFVATYGRLNNGSELLTLKYVLSEASSIG